MGDNGQPQDPLPQNPLPQKKVRWVCGFVVTIALVTFCLIVILSVTGVM